jgi:hypothetical protein
MMQYFVIIYDLSCDETLNVVPFEEDAHAALQFATEQELEHLGDHLTFNLVSVQDESRLKTDFARFFRNIQTDWNLPAKMHGCVHD